MSVPGQNFNAKRLIFVIAPSLLNVFLVLREKRISFGIMHSILTWRLLYFYQLDIFAFIVISLCVTSIDLVYSSFFIFVLLA